MNDLDKIAGFDVNDVPMDNDAAPTVVGPASSLSLSGEEDIIDRHNSINNVNETVQYHGDVFFIHGGASRFVKMSHLPTIASYFPNHMLTTIRGSGHWVHAEAPDDTIALLKRYLDR